MAQYNFYDILAGRYYKNNDTYSSYPYYKILDKKDSTTYPGEINITWSAWNNLSPPGEWQDPANMDAKPYASFAQDFEEISWLDLPADVPICPHDMGVVVPADKRLTLVWREGCVMTVEEILPGDEVYKYAK